MEECIICNSPVDEENAAVLEIGAYGKPKYLCTECSSDLDTMTLGRDLNDISLAVDRFSKKIQVSDLSQKTMDTLTSILDRAAARAKAIKDGSYDFALDEVADEDEGFDEIPEELLETEEDIELDRQDKEKEEKLNHIFDIISFIAAIGVVGFAIWKILDMFVL